MRVQLEPAYLLHIRPYRESSLLLEGLTDGYGRVGLVASGGRSRWRGLLQAFQPLLLSWRAKGELGTLTGAERISVPAATLGGQALYCGLYINELLVRLLARQDAHPGLLAQYRECLGGIADTATRAAALRRFELSLLESIGFAPLLDSEADSQRPVQAESWYRYDPASGPTETAVGDDPDRVSGRALLALAEGDYSDRQTVREMKPLLQRLLRYHLGDRPLKSQAILRSLNTGSR